MATPRTSQSRQKRVQQIADDAAAKIAAESDVEEDVVVTVEELPPGGPDTTARGITSRPAPAVPFVSPFDARRLVEESFRFVEALLASQKEFALKLAGTIERSRAA
jgi:hypothetical protein